MNRKYSLVRGWNDPYGLRIHDVYNPWCIKGTDTRVLCKNGIYEWFKIPKDVDRINIYFTSEEVEDSYRVTQNHGYKDIWMDGMWGLDLHTPALSRVYRAINKNGGHIFISASWEE